MDIVMTGVSILAIVILAVLVYMAMPHK